MLNANFIIKSVRYNTPLLISQRWKVRILPKEHYGDDETMFMKARKPNPKSWINIVSILHKMHNFADFRNWLKLKEENEIRHNQRYIPERHQTLGPDLATAQFITARDGKIKFFGSDKWMTKEDLKNGKIPSTFVPQYYVEEIDASETYLCYEGLENLCNLMKLKKLKLNNCSFVDDWCLSRFHMFANTLEYLDVSGCHLVTERGICTLHILKKLKTLVIKDNPNIQHKELVSLLLQDIIPECDIIGINYSDPVLLKRLESYMH